MAKGTASNSDVVSWLREGITEGAFDDNGKLISENKIADKFRISRHAARTAVSILENEGLVTRIRGSGTYIDRDLIQQQLNVGVLLTYANDYTFPDMIIGIEEVFSGKNISINLALTHNRIETERNQIFSMLKANVNGLIVEAAKSTLTNLNLDVYMRFAERNIPVIFINTYHSDLYCNYIVKDDEEGGRIATEHLIKQGHRKIGGMFNQDSIQGSLRYKGFVNKLYEENLKVDESCVIRYTDWSMEQLFSSENLPRIAQAFSNCTAVVCYSDSIAHMLYEAAPRLGINIPRDLSVVSFDDSYLSRLITPTLTSVSHPGTLMGKLAAESILKMIDDPGYKLQHTYKPSLVIRNSVRNINPV